jgi:spore germination protein KB
MTQDKITKFEFFVIEFYIIQGFFVGEAFSKLYYYTNKDTWISIILGTLLGIIILYINDKLNKKVNNDINKNLKNNIIKYLYYPIIYLYYLLVIILPLLLTNVLINSYYLQNTSHYLIILPFIFLTIFLALKGIKTIAKVGEIFLPVSVTALASLFLGFIPYMKICNLLPLLTVPSSNILISTLFYAVFTTLPMFLLIDTKLNFYDTIKNYLIISLIIFIINFTVTAVLGKFFLKIYSFPEYMSLKRIKLLSFIENIENIGYIPWFGNVLIMVSLGINRLYHFLNNKILFGSTILLIIIILCLYLIPNYSYIISLYKNAPYIMTIFLLLLEPLLYIFTKKDG